MKKKPQSNTPRRPAEGPGMDLPSFCGWDGDTLVLNVLDTPAAGKDAIGKPKGNQLRVSVTAAPVAGSATDHMVAFLAREFGVPVSHVTVVFGRYNANKQLRIRAPTRIPPVVEKALAEG